MAKPKIVRGLARGLEVLRALNDQNYATASQLGRTTRLPRPTVHRLLYTLSLLGYVERVVGSDSYRIKSAAAELAKAVDARLTILEIAGPIIQDFSQKIMWPVEVLIFDGHSMVIRQAASSPRALEIAYIGLQVPLLSTAPGRAFLAHLPYAERTSVIRLLKEPKPDEATVERVFQEVHRRGCGFRDGGASPASVSFALPIMIAEKPIAALTIRFIRSALPLEKAIRQYLPSAREIVQMIEYEAAQKINHQLNITMH